MARDRQGTRLVCSDLSVSLDYTLGHTLLEGYGAGKDKTFTSREKVVKISASIE